MNRETERTIILLREEFNKGYNKGKQEAQKEELEFFKELLFSYNSRWFKEKIIKRIGDLKSQLTGDKNEYEA